MFRVLSFAGAAFAAVLISSVAFAGGNGAQTFTDHAHGTDMSQVGVIGITPPPALPAGCPIPLPAAIVPISGNAVQHGTTNKTGFWFTSTVTANVNVFAGVVIDEDQDVAPVGDVLYTGRATLWFGESDNLRNETSHVTIDLHLTSASDGSMVRLHGNFGFTSNADGDIVATPENLSCVVS